MPRTEWACPECGAHLTLDGAATGAFCVSCASFPAMTRLWPTRLARVLVSDEVPTRLRGIETMMRRNGDVRAR